MQADAHTSNKIASWTLNEVASYYKKYLCPSADSIKLPENRWIRSDGYLMQFQQLRLQNFRNIPFANLSVSDHRCFFLGRNAQGKSNFLEALGLVTALRSFRTSNRSLLPRKGFREYTLVYEVEMEAGGLSCIEIHWSSGGHRVIVDGEKVTRLADYIGRFPTVTLCSGDWVLLRGSPSVRRRFLDLVLSVVDPAYYKALRGFHQGIAERNHLLKNGGSAAELFAFESGIASQAGQITCIRKKGISRLDEALRSVYNAIAEEKETPSLEFKMNVDCSDPEMYLKLLYENRERDRILRATQRGPHRDDCQLNLNGHCAREYASDGQQRGLCVALRMAQANFYRSRLRIIPVLLVDDVLGELDPVRRERFWRACPEGIQIVATGTQLPPEPENWKISEVEAGKVK